VHDFFLTPQLRIPLGRELGRRQKLNKDFLIRSVLAKVVKEKTMGEKMEFGRNSRLKDS
jgi:hypothetical protein